MLSKITNHKKDYRECTNRPRNGQTDEAVNHRWQIYFFVRESKLSDVRQPLLVWSVGTEVSIEQIVCCRRNLPLIWRITWHDWVAASQQAPFLSWAVVWFSLKYKQRSFPFLFWPVCSHMFPGSRQKFRVCGLLLPGICPSCGGLPDKDSSCPVKVTDCAGDPTVHIEDLRYQSPLSFRCFSACPDWRLGLFSTLIVAFKMSISICISYNWSFSWFHSSVDTTEGNL